MFTVFVIWTRVKGFLQCTVILPVQYGHVLLLLIYLVELFLASRRFQKDTKMGPGLWSVRYTGIDIELFPFESWLKFTQNHIWQNHTLSAIQ